jgi:hypothetical protein
MTKNWNEINWKKCAVRLSALQYEILIASREGDIKLVTKLQYELACSFAARTKILQSNQQDYLSKIQKRKCTECDQSLFNGEDIIVLKGSLAT